MADESVSITPGAGADIAVDTVAGKHYQRVKLDLGGDGANVPLALGQTTKANSIPVTNASDDTITTSLAAIQAAVELIDNAVSGNGLVTKVWDGTTTASVRELGASDALNVSIVDGAGAQITSFGGAGGTSQTDGDAFTAGASVGTPLMGVYESAPTAVTDNDMATIGMNASRALKVEVAGSTVDVAHDTADSGNPVKVGGKAVSSLPAAVTTADRANMITDLFGRPLVAHIDPGMQIWKSANFTTTQTGGIIWDPAAGKRIAITYLAIGTYATTAARLILFFSATADTTYTAGTDQLVFAASFAPSATAKPGAIIQPASPIYSATADYELKVTTDGNLSADITMYGYEY